MGVKMQYSFISSWITFLLILICTLMAGLEICIDTATKRNSNVAENGGHHLNGLFSFSYGHA